MGETKITEKVCHVDQASGTRKGDDSEQDVSMRCGVCVFSAWHSWACPYSEAWFLLPLLLSQRLGVLLSGGQILALGMVHCAFH